MKQKYFFILLLFLFLSGVVKAQESALTTGGVATGGGASVSYSIGETVYTTNSDNEGSVAQGVQQAYEVSLLDVEEYQSNISLFVFPNPTSHNLLLKASDFLSEKLSYVLMDIEGRTLVRGETKEIVTTIETENLPSAMYFLNVLNNENKIVKSFKVIKK